MTASVLAFTPSGKSSAPPSQQGSVLGFVLPPSTSRVRDLIRRTPESAVVMAELDRIERESGPGEAMRVAGHFVRCGNTKSVGTWTAAVAVAVLIVESDGTRAGDVLDLASGSVERYSHLKEAALVLREVLATRQTGGAA